MTDLAYALVGEGFAACSLDLSPLPGGVTVVVVALVLEVCVFLQAPASTCLPLLALCLHAHERNLSLEGGDSACNVLE